MGFGSYGFPNSPKKRPSPKKASPPKPFSRESIYWR